MKFTIVDRQIWGAGHVISVTKNTISGILFRVIHADSNVEKFPTAWAEIDPKSNIMGWTID